MAGALIERLHCIDAHTCNVKVGACEPPPKSVYNHRYDSIGVDGFQFVAIGIADGLVEVNLHV